MSKQKPPETTDPENPEWKSDDFKRALPLEALPEALKRTLGQRGRPRKLAPKVPISLRLSPDVIEGFKATGKGWQTRLDTALREWLDKYHAA